MILCRWVQEHVLVSVDIRRGRLVGTCVSYHEYARLINCSNLVGDCLLLLSWSNCCLLLWSVDKCRLLACIGGLLLVVNIVAVPAIVIAAIVPVICSIVTVVILLLNLVDWHPAISSKMPWAIAALVANRSFAFSFIVVFSSVVVFSFSFSCLSVASSVTFSCILSFAHVLSFTFAFVAFSFSFGALSLVLAFAFSFVAFPSHSNVHWLWAIVVVRVCIVHHLQLAECCSCSVVFYYDASHC